MTRQPLRYYRAVRVCSQRASAAEKEERGLRRDKGEAAGRGTARTAMLRLWFVLCFILSSLGRKGVHSGGQSDSFPLAQ